MKITSGKCRRMVELQTWWKVKWRGDSLLLGGIQTHDPRNGYGFIFIADISQVQAGLVDLCVVLECADCPRFKAATVAALQYQKSSGTLTWSIFKAPYNSSRAPAVHLREPLAEHHWYCSATATTPGRTGFLMNVY